MENTKKSHEYHFNCSEKLLERALKFIPLGTQTFSKSTLQYPKGVSPLYISRARGSRIWDVDGNEFIDFVNSLCAVILGYNDEDVDGAVRAQMDDGILFSLPHPIEIEVAEKLCEIIPCAELVRFGKNGSDATSAAIRLARAYTRRDHVVSCGYHGWQDWFIGTTSRRLGVPEAVRNLTHTFPYNDVDALNNLFKKRPGDIACVIMEPMNSAFPFSGFLEEVKDLCHKNGALLIFDEMITGFRYARGGAQEYFNVIPDLATFGKALANGYPLSAIVGRAEVMSLMEEIFFSFTMGGETLSLAAAKATLKKIINEPVIETLNENGKTIFSGINKYLEKHELKNTFNICGHPSWSFLSILDTEKYTSAEIKTFFLQEMFSRRILTLGTHNLSYAHQKTDLEKLLKAYDEVFGIIREAIDKNTLKEKLNCEPLTPVFSVRRN